MKHSKVRCIDKQEYTEKDVSHEKAEHAWGDGFSLHIRRSEVDQSVSVAPETFDGKVRSGNFVLGPKVEERLRVLHFHQNAVARVVTVQPLHICRDDYVLHIAGVRGGRPLQILLIVRSFPSAQVHWYPLIRQNDYLLCIHSQHEAHVKRNQAISCNIRR